MKPDSSAISFSLDPRAMSSAEADAWSAHSQSVSELLHAGRRALDRQVDLMALTYTGRPVNELGPRRLEFIHRAERTCIASMQLDLLLGLGALDTWLPEGMYEEINARGTECHNEFLAWVKGQEPWEV